MEKTPLVSYPYSVYPIDRQVNKVVTTITAR